jgi:hypothetical protein
MGKSLICFRGRSILLILSRLRERIVELAGVSWLAKLGEGIAGPRPLSNFA